MSLELPDGLTDLLQNFTLEVVRNRPNDLIKFAIDYFEHLNRNREIPEGLSDLLQKFTIEVIRHNPNDLLSFAVDYFQGLFQKREKSNKEENRSLKIANRRPTPYDNKDDEESNAKSKEENLTSEEDIEEMSMFTKSKSFGKRRSVAAEKYNPESDSEDNLMFVQKSKKERSYLSKTIASILVFRSLDNRQIDKIIDAMFPRNVNENDIIIEQGNFNLV
jgi:cAMP-dependent protein kinase regulator